MVVLRSGVYETGAGMLTVLMSVVRPRFYLAAGSVVASMTTVNEKIRYLDKWGGGFFFGGGLFYKNLL